MEGVSPAQGNYNTALMACKCNHGNVRQNGWLRRPQSSPDRGGGDGDGNVAATKQPAFWESRWQQLQKQKR